MSMMSGACRAWWEIENAMKIVAVFYIYGANGTFAATAPDHGVSLMAGRSHVFPRRRENRLAVVLRSSGIDDETIDWLKPPVDSVVNYEMTRYRQLRPGSVAQWLVVLWRQLQSRQ